MKRKDTHNIFDEDNDFKLEDNFFDEDNDFELDDNTVDEDNNYELEEGFSTNKNHDLIFKIVACALLIAMVVVLQAFSTNIRIGEFSITLALIPIIIGAIFFGPLIGGVLGFVMGIVVLLLDSHSFWVINPFGTIVICLCKSTIAGYITGVLYNNLSKYNEKVAIVISALVCPIVNTGIFALGCIIFFFNTLKEWSGGTDAFGYLFKVMIGTNFIIEFIVISILSPSFVFIIKLLRQIVGKNR